MRWLKALRRLFCCCCPESSIKEDQGPKDIGRGLGKASPSNPAFCVHGENINVKTMEVVHAGGDVQISRTYIDAGQQAFGPGWKLLFNYVAPNAIHTSKAVSRIGKCDDGTRVKALAKIGGWATGTPLPVDRKVLCMTGAAGSGKSSIALTVAQKWEQEHILAASFFLSSSDKTRNSCWKVVSTIAYQLALQSPSFRDAISSVAWANPGVFEAATSTQITELIVQPLAKIGNDSIAGTIILIDGVDECGETDQEELMDIVKKIVVDTPFRAFIVGRPGVVMSGEIESGELLDTSHHLRLSDDKEFDATDDIKHTLRIQLPKLVKKDLSDIDEHVDAITEASSGQYIYPATVIRHVKEGKRDSPMKRLDSILAWIRGPKREESGAPYLLRTLDTLYRNILLAAIEHAKTSAKDTGQNRDPIVLALRAFASLHISTVLEVESQSETVYDQLLDLTAGTFNSVVCDLRSLVRVRDPAETGRVIQFYHRTCLEFLQNAHRIGEDKADLYFEEGRINSYALKHLGNGFKKSSVVTLGANDSFTADEGAWVKCTSASLLGSLFRSIAKAKGAPDPFKGFKLKEQKELLEELKGWVNLTKEHPQLAGAELVKAALSDWMYSLDIFQRHKTGELASAASSLVDVIRTIVTSD